MSDNMKNIPSIPESREGMEYLVNLGRERTDVRVVEINGEYYTPDEPLYQTDTYTWRNEAIANIGQWLREKLDGHPEFVVIA